MAPLLTWLGITPKFSVRFAHCHGFYDDREVPCEPNLITRFSGME